MYEEIMHRSFLLTSRQKIEKEITQWQLVGIAVFASLQYNAH